MRARWEGGGGGEGGLLIGQNRDRPVWETSWKRNGDRETNSRTEGGRRWWRGRKTKREKKGGVHGRPQIHGFDICVLLDSLLTARLSCPPLHLLLLLSPSPPLVGCWKKGKTVSEGRRVEGAWDKTDPFSLDAVLCQACGDTFKDEGEVNVVGRMREPL